MLSKKERKLKDDSRPDDDFNDMKKALIDSGVFDKKPRQGMLVYWNTQKGYGFIRGDDKNKYFIHCSDIKDKASPLKGQRYKFKAGGDSKAKDATMIVTEAIGSVSKG